MAALALASKVFPLRRSRLVPLRAGHRRCERIARFLFRFILFAALLSLVPACGGAARKRRKSAAAAAFAPQPLLVGTIALVNVEGSFVLIDNGRHPSPPSGAALRSFTAGAPSGELVATEVRKRPFVIADIRSGSPQKGDRVFFTGAAPAPNTPPPPESEQQPGPAAPPDPLALPQLSPGAGFDQ
jgi:hypothetical protein